jgi:hypothetical protein
MAQQTLRVSCKKGTRTTQKSFQENGLAGNESHWPCGPGVRATPVTRMPEPGAL